MAKILIVDDEIMIRSGLGKIIRWNEIGFEMVGAVGSAGEALKMIAQIPVDAILTDINMPDMTGLELIRRARKELPRVKAVIIRRGDIYYADLRPVVGSEQGGVRPVLIIQNDVGNRHSPTVICAAITSRMNKAKLPTHVELNRGSCDMIRDSVILLEQVRTIDKQRLKEKICHIDGEVLQKVDEALRISLELHT